MTHKNRFGLSRDIPGPIRREVRQRCAFGCVLCGKAIVTYHHFDPPFADARAHLAAGITLLCPNCHSEVTNGQVSDESLRAANQMPYTIGSGFSAKRLDLKGLPNVILGGLTCVAVPTILEVDGQTLLGFREPEAPGAPFGLEAHFFDGKGRPIAEVVRNEWRTFRHNWDVEVEGVRTVIRSDHRDIALVFRIEPPSRVIVERIHMFYRGLRLVGEEHAQLSAYLPNGELWFRAHEGARFISCAKGIVLQGAPG